MHQLQFLMDKQCLGAETRALIMSWLDYYSRLCVGRPLKAVQELEPIQIEQPDLSLYMISFFKNMIIL